MNEKKKQAEDRMKAGRPYARRANHAFRVFQRRNMLHRRRDIYGTRGKGKAWNRPTRIKTRKGS